MPLDQIPVTFIPETQEGDTIILPKMLIWHNIEWVVHAIETIISQQELDNLVLSWMHNNYAFIREKIPQIKAPEINHTQAIAA